MKHMERKFSAVVQGYVYVDKGANDDDAALTAINDTLNPDDVDSDDPVMVYNVTNIRIEDN